MPGVPRTIEITAAGHSSRCWVTGDGEKKYAVGTYDVQFGDVIGCYTDGSRASTQKRVTVNGVTVFEGSGTTTSIYRYTVRKSVKVAFTNSNSLVAIDITEV